MNIPYRLSVLLHKLQQADCGPVRHAGGGLRCRCPAHADNGPSLYIDLGEDKILIHCGAGCTTQAVCDSLDHQVADLFFDVDDEWVDADADLKEERTSPNPEVEPPAEPEDGGAETAANLRHDIYSAFLSRLELSTAHFDGLRGRGLPAEEIDRRGYKTADSGMIRKALDALLDTYGRERVLTVPGFIEKGDRVVFLGSRGLLIPVCELGGHIAALKVRHDSGTAGSKYTWASGKGTSCGNVVHVPLGVPVPSPVVRLTEGEIKADVATVLSQIPTISAPGVGNWPLAVPVLQALGAQTVLLAMDQDGKPGTLSTIEKALIGLTEAGLDVVLEWWDGGVAKGIDDLLAAGGRPEVVTGLAALVRVRQAVEAPEPDAPDSPEPEPAPWPVDVFPPALATFAREVAEATATPPDFAGLTMLVTAGAAIGNSRVLSLKENSWCEGPRFYAANVGDPATGKTPAMEAVVGPYQALEQASLSEYEQQKNAYDEATSEYDRVLRANRSLPQDERQPLPDVPEEPRPPERLLVMDATVESLAPLLARNPRGLLMPQDEGVAWVRGMNQYKSGRGADRQFWLSTWSGNYHCVDRKGHGPIPIWIPRPFMNVICGMQPDMLGELADHQGRSDGFLHRVLFVFPRAITGADWVETTVSQESSDAWASTLCQLRQLTMEPLANGGLDATVVRFSEAAKQTWIDWWNAHAAEMRGPELPIQLVGPWGKLKSYAARITLVLHYLWLIQSGKNEGDVDVASVERAVRLIDYFKAHLRLVYDRLRWAPEENRFNEVLDWIRRRGGRCTARELLRTNKFENSDKAKKLLRELEARGYGQIESHVARNGRQVQCFVFNPG